MSERKKMAVKIIANIILSSILAIATQTISNTIVNSTKWGMIISSIVFFILFVFIVADIINAVDEYEIQYFNIYHNAAWKWDASLLLNAFVINIIVKKILAQQYNNILIWINILIIAIVIAQHFWRKLIIVT